MDTKVPEVRPIWRRLVAPAVEQRANLINFVERHPIALIPAGFAYAVATILNAGIAVGIFFALGPIALKLNAAYPQDYQAGITLLWFTLLESVIVADYLYLGVRCFVSAAEFNGYAAPILRVLQLVLITVIIFAAVHYYVALFSVEHAYHGIEPLNDDDRIWLNWADRLTHVPSLDTLINCIYFSTVTMATVGYGDVFPVSRYAKIATIVQIMVSFGLIVVILGWAIGNAKDLASRIKEKSGS